MRPLASLPFALAALSGPLLAQTTWLVNPSGGPGVSFTSLFAAVTSPAVVDGDTILVVAAPTWNPGSFGTAKGLTIVGVGGNVPMPDVFVNGLPAGRTFRMVGFARHDPGLFQVRVSNCAGAVHRENLRATLGGGALSCCSVTIDSSASVTLRDITTFGDPAITVQNSVASVGGLRRRVAAPRRAGDVHRALTAGARRARQSSSRVMQMLKPSSR